MESLLRNAQSYACILKRCQTEEVVNWKEEDLKRALHWTQYFKNVQPRIRNSLIGCTHKIVPIILIMVVLYVHCLLGT